MKRRALVAAAALAPAGSRAQAIRRGRGLAFPRDHGAHPDATTEWWYATGWLGDAAAPRYGFQLTFFRSRTGLADAEPSRFAARQILFAHAALTDVAGGRHLHAQRIARWNGDPAAPLAHAALEDGDVVVGPWSLRRRNGRWIARLPAPDFALDLTLAPTQPVLLQGEAGWSRKGPLEAQASHYYSEPQLAAQATVTLDGRRVEAGGRGWLDREWSDAYLAPEAVGWDWIGIDLLDGSALMAFRIRRPDGDALWAGGSFRRPGEATRAFGPADVRFVPGRTWASPASHARYPVEWRIETPAGTFGLRALVDAQELDSRASTGAIYWEGLAELVDASGRRAGLGYLEMTGYAAKLRLGA